MTMASKRLATVDTRDPDWAPDLTGYDLILVAFSGGKDSVACVLRLLDLGVDPSRIELHHHDIDGRQGSTLMDWPVTAAYCRAFAKALGIRILFSWKVGGFEREMLRDGDRTAPISWEEPSKGADGDVIIRTAGGTRGKLGVRRRYPQVAADLRVRWCSAYLKIDVMDRVFRRDPRFNRGGRFLILTGERAQESSARAKYKVFEPDRADNRKGKRAPRHIDHWRAVHAWTEERVWEAIERHRINPHPAYRLGWGRVSCAACIFGSADQWASLRAVNPDQFGDVADYETTFGRTIHRKRSAHESADLGTPYPETQGADLVAEALDHDWDRRVILEPGAWTLPAGAYGDSAGPT